QSTGTNLRMAWAAGDPNRVYFVRGRSLYRSDDSGLNFRRMAQVAFYGAIAVDPTNADVVYLGAFFGDFFSGGLFKSTDGGTTAASLGVSGSFRSLSIDERAPSTVYAGNADGGVLRSDDSGANWTDASAGLPAGQTLAVAADPLVAGRVYAWIQAAGLFASGDRGATWSAVDIGESALRSGIETGPATMGVDRPLPGRAYLATHGGLQIETLPTDN